MLKSISWKWFWAHVFTFNGLRRFGIAGRNLRKDALEPDYRNKFLVEAMTNIGLVETVGGGIRKMFAIQQNKGFPLPDYNLSDNKVEVVITGKVVDKDFADILMINTADLPI